MTDLQNETPRLSAYTERDVLATVQRILDTVGLRAPYDPLALPVDQYHSGGHEAVTRLAAAMGISSDQRVLDVGSGLGGPARLIAATTGAHVDGVDITAEYVRAAQWLTEQTNLSDLVTATHVEVAELPRTQPYDAAITIHVQMNVEGKTAWYRSIAEHLRPGATLGIWEVCTTTGADLDWPMPWSVTGDDSYLATSDELRAAIEDAGFTAAEWLEDDIWLKEWFSALVANGSAPGNAGLSVIDNGPVRAANFAGAFMSGQVTVVRGILTRNDR
jgi:sarcosine/dimethylglycine N-methyltransferase